MRAIIRYSSVSVRPRINLIGIVVHAEFTMGSWGMLIMGVRLNLFKNDKGFQLPAIGTL
jgi:hypothetical protein